MEGEEFELSIRSTDQNQTRNGQQDLQPNPISRPLSIQTTSEDSQSQTTDIITAKDVGLISVFGLVLPSVDQGTDYNTSANLINYVHKCRSVLPSSDNAHECFYTNYNYGNWSRYSDEEMEIEETRIKRYGYAMLVPILVTTIFTLQKWWKLEKEPNRLSTFYIAILQLYPQYRALRILYLGIRKKASWRKEKNVYEEDLSSLGKFNSYENCCRTTRMHFQRERQSFKKCTYPQPKLKSDKSLQNSKIYI